MLYPKGNLPFRGFLAVNLFNILFKGFYRFDSRFPVAFERRSFTFAKLPFPEVLLCFRRASQPREAGSDFHGFKNRATWANGKFAPKGNKAKEIKCLYRRKFV